MAQNRPNSGIAAATQLAQRHADEVRMARAKADLLDVTAAERDRLTRSGQPRLRAPA